MAVDAFLAGRLPFPAIAHTIERALDAAAGRFGAPVSLEDVRAADAWARAFSRETLGTLPS
jgi:1-deoxy-D-xylulose-5-phosphate reductoisomerase